MKLAKVTKIAATMGLLCTSVFSINAGAVSTANLFEQERIDIQNAVRVYYPSPAMADKATISFHNQLLESHKDQGYLIMQLNDIDKAKLKSFGFTFAPATQWIKKRESAITKLTQAAAKNPSGVKAADETIPGFPCYSTVEGTFEKAAALATSYPNLAQWVDIGDSWSKTDNAESGYDINVLQMTNSETAGDKPVLFIHSAMHAREYATAELTLRFADYLLNQYGSNADVSWILDNHQVHIVFHMNPDGRKKAEEGLFWRKNFNSNFCTSAPNSRGVDLNRNFTHFWNSTDNGSSGDECSEVYRGPTAGSEPETQAIENYIRSLYPDRRGPLETDAAPLDTSGMHIDVHSFSELVLWPWGHTGDLAPNATQLTTLGRKLAYFNGYTPMQGVGLYPTDGTSDDVSYGELGVAAYTFELGTSFFQSCSGFNNSILPDNLQSLLYAAKVVRAPYIIPAGPDATDLTLNGQSTLNVNSGEAVTVKTNITDQRYRNSNGAEPSQVIGAAEYYIDQAPWAQGAQAHALQSTDGTLNSESEFMQAQIDTTGLSEGKHMIYVRGKDADDNWGAVSAAYLLIGQTNMTPVAEFTSSCQGLRCTFDATQSSDSDGEIVNYLWQLSDGTEINGDSAVVNVEHLFAQNADATVTLTVTDDKGATAQSTKQIAVENLPPVADFSLNCTDNVCSFDASGSGDLDGTITSYEWSFGGTVSGSGSGTNSAHTFSVAGDFEVTLTVTDNFGATHSKTLVVSVTLPVVVDTSGNNSSSGGGGSLGFAGLLLLAVGFGRRFRFK